MTLYLDDHHQESLKNGSFQNHEIQEVRRLDMQVKSFQCTIHMHFNYKTWQIGSFVVVFVVFLFQMFKYTAISGPPVLKIKIQDHFSHPIN